MIVYQTKSDGSFVIDMHPQVNGRKFGRSQTMEEARTVADDYAKNHGHVCSKECAPWKLLFGGQL
jgi:hypothetical protein